MNTAAVFDVETSRSFVDHFAHVVATVPDRCAVVCRDHTVTYGALSRLATVYAQTIAEYVDGDEPIVAICMDRSVDLMAALIGSLQTAAVFLPIDPETPPERVRTIIEQSRAALVLTERQYTSLFDDRSVRLICLESLNRSGQPSVGPRQQVSADPATLAYVIYTSGSTGPPKGVAVTRDAFYGYIRWAADYYGLNRDAASVFHTSIAFDLTLTSVFCPLLAGMRCVLVPDNDGLAGVARLLDDPSERIGLVKLTPSHLRLLERQADGAPASRWSCDVLICGGEQLTGDHVASWRRRCPEGRIFNEYGPTEATVGCAVAEVGSTPANPQPVPIGVAIDRSHLHIYELSEVGLTSPAEGQLFIGGDCLARGYLHAPGATAERFVPDPVGDGDRIYRTGDRVVRVAASDQFVFVRRIDRQRKLNGVRIELAEIEQVLEGYPGVRVAAVVPDEQNEGLILRAFLQLDDAGRDTVERSEVVRYLKSRLLAAAVPSEFYVVQAVPVASSGKVDARRLLDERHRYDRLADTFVPPRNPTEELLASLFKAILDVDEVGIDDSFFALDGNSMKSIQFTYEARKLGLDLSTRLLLTHQTIRRIAEVITAPGPRAASAGETAGQIDLIAQQDRQRLPATVVDAYPLAMLQAGTVLESDSGLRTYHNINSYHLECPLDVRALEASIALAVQRHPILRTCYDYVTYQQPLQLVHCDAVVPLTVVDIAHLSPESQDQYLSAFLAEESRTHFDWTMPPLLRFFIHKRGPGRLQFTLSKHHSILDGWSAATLIAEIFGNYFALLRGETPPLQGALETTYRQYVAEERQALQSDEARSYWTTLLNDADHRPIRRRRGEPAQPDYVNALATTRVVPIEPDVSERLKAVARRARIPLKSLLLTIHLRMLARMTGTNRVLTGVVTHGRPETADGDRALGLFINTLPLPATIDDRVTWLEFAARVFDQECRQFPHRRYPMARIKQQLGWGSLFDSIFYYTSFHVFRRFRRSDEIKFISSAVFEETEIPFTTAFSLHPLTSIVGLKLHCRVDRFSETQIAEIAEQFHREIVRAADEPEAAVLESHRQDVSAARTQPVSRRAADADARTIFEMVAEQARLHPDAIALAVGPERISYHTLLGRANALAGRLAHAGVRIGDVVPLCLRDVTTTMAAMLAVNRVGGCFVVLDADWPDDRLQTVLEQLAPSLILAEGTSAGRLTGWRLLAPTVTGDGVVDARCPSAAPIDVPAYIVFTSGSTGAPKGVVVTNRNLWYSTAARLEYYEGGYPHFLLLSRLTFDSAYAGVWGTLAAGGTLHAVDVAPVDVRSLAATIERDGVTHLLAVPSLYRVLLTALCGERVRSLRAVILAGEELARDIVDAHRRILPDVTMFNEYGPSEATVWSTVAEIACDAATDSEAVPIGGPIRGTQAQVLDGVLQPVRAGDSGELYLSSEGIAAGYWQAPRETASRFLPNPCATHADARRRYRTGDLVRQLDDGSLVFIGRTDNQIKVRGVRIAPEEIERAFRACFDGRDAIACAHEHTSGTKRLRLYYTSDNGDAGVNPRLDPREIRRALAQTLPPYAIPDEFCAIDRLTSLPNGKVDRRSAAANGSATTKTHHGLTSIERALASLWADATGAADIGPDDNFFEIGGESLAANQVALRVEKLFGVRFPLRLFYENPTIASHASVLATHAAERGVDVERLAAMWNQLDDRDGLALPVQS